MGVVAEMADDVAVMYAGKIIESGSAQHVLTTPDHPYTQALLRSIPKLGMDRTVPLKVIPGAVPSPLRWPVGCRFAPRCEHAFDRCRVEEPPLLGAGGHAAACWLLDSSVSAKERADIEHV
jgi:oligopeptide/dipeptide ABC transporter ATP-binding protein